MQKHSLQFNYKVITVYIAAFIGLIAVQIGITVFFDIESLSEVNQATFGAAMNLVLYGFLTIVFFFIAKIYLFKNQWLYFKEKPAFSFFMVGFGMYLIFAVLFLIGAIYEVTGGPSTPRNQDLINNILTSAWYNGFMVFVFAVLFAPIVEEMVFRKAIFGIIFSKFGAAVAILGNSLIFAMIHVTGEFSAWIGGTISFWDFGLITLPYISMSIIISFIYFYSGKLIWVAITVHMLVNLISVSSGLLGL
ncbi:lysostaphin resistance A-like protein [Liberiplasma polymorphum]|jgi:uncharacterized protein|uniref:CPBP family intramembrane glutamic endopeptidase n=1 Tax=Liberiplasma polymorphum TaxID=3374570 RepID=UPI00377304F6